MAACGCWGLGKGLVCKCEYERGGRQRGHTHGETCCFVLVVSDDDSGFLVT